MPFGFSIGDFIAVTGIAFNLCESIRSFPADHLELVFQLETFRCSLQEVKDVTSRCQLTPQTAKIAEQQLANCYQFLQELEKTIVKYDSSSQGIPGGKRATLKRLRWGIYKKGESMKLVDKLQNQINSFNLFLNAYNMQDPPLLEGFSAHSYGFHRRMLQETDVIRRRVEQNAPNPLDPWSDFEPIRFIDALDRKITFTFEMCKTWESFEELLKLSFRGSAGKSWVDAGSYMITDESTGNTLTAKEWSSGIKSGMTLSMAMILHKQKAVIPDRRGATDKTEHNCPSCSAQYTGVISEELKRVRCESGSGSLQESSTRQLAGLKELDTPLDTSDIKHFRRLQVLMRKLNIEDDDVQKALAK